MTASSDRQGSDPKTMNLAETPQDVDVDEGLQALKEIEAVGLQLDEATSTTIRRRADMVVMPIICFIYGVQFLDRTALSYASIMGLLKELILSGEQFSWLGSIFFFSYLGAEFVNGRILQRFPMAKYLSACTIVWGVLSACIATVKTDGAFLALRFLLGIFQASVSPALILLVSQWYTRPEQITRTAVWMSANGAAQIFGGLVAYGLAEGYLQYHWSMTPWRVMFILFGCMTVLIGLISMLLLPDSPLNARWLKPELRNLAVERVRVNQQGIGNKKWKMYQIRELVTDPFIWTLLIFSIASNIASGGITNFFSLIVLSFGFSPNESLLYTAPAGAVAIALTLGWGFVARAFHCRLVAGMACMALALLGIILIVALPSNQPNGKLAGYYLTMGVAAADAAILSMISTNIAGYTKKTTISALYFVGYCVGNIIGPQTFQSKDAPLYRPAEIGVIVVLAICLLDMAVMYFILNRRNQHKRRQREHSGYEKRAGSEFWDLTDRENLEFEYSL